jgi:hypothetical protein
LMRGCIRVSPLGTDVTGVVVRPVGAITRCVSVADTSLSLSLSLSTPNLSGLKPSSGAENGAYSDLLAGSRRAPGRGFRRSWRRPLAVSPCAGVRVIGLAGSPYNPWGTSEEVPSRAPTRVGFVVPGRRGLFHAWPRRSSLTVLVDPLGQAGPAPLPAEGSDLFAADRPAHLPGRGTSSPGRPGRNLRVPR